MIQLLKNLKKMLNDYTILDTNTNIKEIVLENNQIKVNSLAEFKFVNYISGYSELKTDNNNYEEYRTKIKTKIITKIFLKNIEGSIYTTDNKLYTMPKKNYVIEKLNTFFS